MPGAQGNVAVMQVGAPASGCDPAPASAHCPCATYAESCALHAAVSVVSGSFDMQLACRSAVAIEPQHDSRSAQADDAGALPVLHAPEALHASAANVSTTTRSREVSTASTVSRVLPPRVIARTRAARARRHGLAHHGPPTRAFLHSFHAWAGGTPFAASARRESLGGCTCGTAHDLVTIGVAVARDQVFVGIVSRVRASTDRVGREERARSS